MTGSLAEQPIMMAGPAEPLPAPPVPPAPASGVPIARPMASLRSGIRDPQRPRRRRAEPPHSSKTLAADADLASTVALDSLGFIQFLSGLERRLGIDLSANIEQLKAVRTLADIVALTERMRAA